MHFDSYIVKNTNLSKTIPLDVMQEKPCFRSINLLKGFTLAEVLITLTIIGVIAAMTVPTLLSNNQKQQYVVGVKKAYSTLSNAIGILRATEPDCEAGVNACFDNAEGDRVSIDSVLENLSISITARAFKNSRISQDATECANLMGGSSSKQACLITADGMIYSSYVDYRAYIPLTRFNIDINGAKGPNLYGRDRFAFEVLEDKVIPKGAAIDPDFASYNANPCSTAIVQEKDSRAIFCTNKVLSENAMNY